MFVRWYRRVAAAVASVSLIIAAFLVFHRRELLVDICPPVSSQRHETQPRRTAQNRTQPDDLRRDVMRSTNNLANRSTTTSKNDSGHTAQRQFVLHRCPASYDITDPQDEWFRTVVVQRSPPTSQVTFTDELLVLTPICDSEQHLRRYFENLCSLAYPHRLMTVVLGEDSSTDNTVQVTITLSHTQLLHYSIFSTRQHIY